MYSHPRGTTKKSGETTREESEPPPGELDPMRIYDAVEDNPSETRRANMYVLLSCRKHQLQFRDQGKKLMNSNSYGKGVTARDKSTAATDQFVEMLEEYLTR